MKVTDDMLRRFRLAVRVNSSSTGRAAVKFDWELELYRQRLRPERGAQPPSESERGWGPASSE